jgi:signal recognition particle subunit SRP54
MKNLLKMVPGLANAVPEEALESVDEKQTGRVEAIILSMTPKERRNPDIINGSRRKRIAAGSGTSVEEVNQLLKNFASSRRGMKEMGRVQSKMKKMNRRRR